jgi:hypothetical protein
MDASKRELKEFRISMPSFFVADRFDLGGRYGLPEHAQLTEYHTPKTFFPSIRPLRGRKSG